MYLPVENIVCIIDVPSIDDTVKRIQAQKGVQGVIIATREGYPIRSTMDNTSTLLYLSSMVALEERASSMVRDIDPTNALLFTRVRSRKFEVIIHTGDDYIVIVIQNPNDST